MNPLLEGRREGRGVCVARLGRGDGAEPTAEGHRLGDASHRGAMGTAGHSSRGARRPGGVVNGCQRTSDCEGDGTGHACQSLWPRLARSQTAGRPPDQLSSRVEPRPGLHGRGRLPDLQVPAGPPPLPGAHEPGAATWIVQCARGLPEPSNHGAISVRLPPWLSKRLPLSLPLLLQQSAPPAVEGAD